MKEGFGDKLTAPAGAGEELCSVSFRVTGLDNRPEREGSTATAPGSAMADFFRLEGGMRLAGKLLGTGSFSMARYTRCMAYEHRERSACRQDHQPQSRRIKRGPYHGELLLIQVSIFVHITEVPDLQSRRLVTDSPEPAAPQVQTVPFPALPAGAWS